MSVLGTSALLPAGARPAGGEATLGDIAGATWDSMRYVENSTAAHDALREVINRRRAEIHAQTGVQLSDPLRDAEEEWRRETLQLPAYPWSLDRWASRSTPREKSEYYDKHLDSFRAQLSSLTEKFPDKRQAIAADRDLWDDAATLARESDERLGVLMASRSGLGKYGALLAGGVAGALEDPVTLLSMVAGGGPGAARTVAGRILTIAGKEALINAASEAAIQPAVQAWRGRAGLDSGLDEAIRNVMFAGALGGMLGGGLGAAGEALSRFIRPADTDRAAAAIAASPQLSEPARAILSGDGLRAAEALAEIRAALPAEARGALDAAERIRATDDARPPTAGMAAHDAAVAAADRLVRAPEALETWPGFRPDEAQMARVVRAIAGEAPPPRQAETPLVDFLIARGGVADFKGELRAIGADGISERFRGRLVKDDGESLDYAREAAAQAGFFDHLYGDAETASNRSTVADLLDALEEEVRVRTGGAARSAEDAALAGLEGTVADIARMAGPAVDDDVLIRAARMSIEDGVDAGDALERVLMGDDLAGDPAGDVASAPRNGEGGIADPAHFEDDLMIGEADLAAIEALDADMEIPFFDDEPAMTPAAFRSFMERQDNLAAVAEACRA